MTRKLTTGALLLALFAAAGCAQDGVVDPYANQANATSGSTGGSTGAVLDPSADSAAGRDVTDGMVETARPMRRVPGGGVPMEPGEGGGFSTREPGFMSGESGLRGFGEPGGT